MKFRKKPIVIEAARFFPDVTPWPDGVVEHRPTIAELEAALQRGDDAGVSPDGRTYAIDTLEGRALFVSPGDWIITGIAGERYPCKPDIFAATYEPAVDSIAEAMAERAAADPNFACCAPNVNLGFFAGPESK